MEQLKVSIIPLYVPSVENLHADFASRFKKLPDLHLLLSVFHKICSRWGVPDIDLFASPQSVAPIYGLGQCQVGSGHRRSLSPMVLRSGLRFPSNPSNSQSDREASPSCGRVSVDNPLLDGSDVVPQVGEPLCLKSVVFLTSPIWW